MKQIPKKVVKVELRPTEYGTPYRCPCCEAELIPVEFIEEASSKSSHHTWCWACGQKLDWE
jgi:transcription elongation factor Elf1